ncbi:MAG: iron-only hydrogenase system regulator [Desulfovibrio sp.]|nr:iron-only hydrogenase system regulator [Desulfovibrio sp.]
MPSPSLPARLGVVCVVLGDREHAARINAIISDFERLIIGRIGVPYRQRKVGVIALLVEGDTDAMGAFTGRLGAVPGVKIRTALFNEADVPAA